MTLQAGYPGQQTMQFRRVKIITVNEEATEVVVRDGTGWQTKLDGTLRPKGMGLPEENEIWLIESVGPMWLLRAQERAGGIDLGPDVNAIIAEEIAKKLAEEAITEAERRGQEAALAAGIIGGNATILIQSDEPAPEHQNINTLWIDTSFDRDRPMRWSVADAQWIAVTDRIAIEAARAAVDAKEAAEAAQQAAEAAEAAAAATLETANAAMDKAEEALASAIGKGRVIYGDPATTPGEPNSLLIGPSNTPYIWVGTIETGQWTPVPDEQLDLLQELLDSLDDILDSQMTVLSSVLGDLAGVQGKSDGQVTIYPIGASPDLGPEDVGDLRLIVDGKVEYWDGTQWVPADEAVTNAALAAAEALNLANQKSTTYFKDTAPTVDDIEPPATAFTINDFWVRSEDNMLHRWNGSTWEPIQDKAIAALTGQLVDLQTELVGIEGRLDGKSTIYVQDTAPDDVGGVEDTGDIWIDTSNDGRLYKVWDGTQWVETDDPRIITILEDLETKITTYYGTTAPLKTNYDLVAGDLWVRDPDNALFRYNGNDWVDVSDSRFDELYGLVSDVQGELLTVEGLADGKATIFFQENAPTGLSGEDQGDIWIKPSTSEFKMWTGSAWALITDPEAIAALQLVKGKITTYYKDTPPVASDIEPPETQFRDGDLWVRSTDSKLHRRQGSNWVVINLPTDEEVDDKIETATNLVNNVSRTGHMKRWSKSTSDATSSLDLATDSFRGVNVPTLKINSSTNTTVYSDDFDVDVTKAYEFRIWLKDTAIVSGANQLYFGMNVYTSDGARLESQRVTVSSGATAAVDANNYFWSGTQTPIGEYIEYVAYMLPLGTDPADAVGLGNCRDNVIITDPRTSRAHLRFLNWRNDGTARDIFAAHMVVTETTMEAIKQAAIGRREAAAALSASDDIRDNIIPSVQEEVVTAGGRFTGATRAPLASDGVGKPVNAIWNQYDGNKLLGSWIWQNNPFTSEMQWTPREPQTVHIDDGTYGELSGLRLTANSISVRHLLVSGNGPNMIIDPGYVDVVLFENRLARSQGTWTLLTTGSAPPRVRTTASSTASVFYMGGDSGSASRYMKIEANQTYRIKYQARAGTNLGNATRPAIRYRNSAGNLVYTGGGDFTAIGTAWKWLTFQWTAPNGATEAEFDIQAQAGNSSWSEYADYSVTPMVDGTMIVEGAINSISTSNGYGINIKPDGSDLSNGVIEFTSSLGNASITLNSAGGFSDLDVSGILVGAGAPILRLRSGTYGTAVEIQGQSIMLDASTATAPGAPIMLLGDTRVNGDLEATGKLTIPNSSWGADITGPVTVGGAFTASSHTYLGTSGSQIDLAGSRVTGAWFSYLPTLTAANTNPSGALTRFGRWQRIGRTVNFSIMLTMGSTFKAGSGAYSVSLPVPAASNRTQIVVGQVRLGNSEEMMFGKIEGGGTVERMWLASGVQVNQGRGWASGDRITLTGTYEASSN